MAEALRTSGAVAVWALASHEQKPHPIFLDFQMPSEHFVESVCKSAWVTGLRLTSLISVSCFFLALLWPETHILLVLLSQNSFPYDERWWCYLCICHLLLWTGVVTVLTGLCSGCTWAGRAEFEFRTHCKWIEAGINTWSYSILLTSSSVSAY